MFPKLCKHLIQQRKGTQGYKYISYIAGVSSMCEFIDGDFTYVINSNGISYMILVYKNNKKTKQLKTINNMENSIYSKLLQKYRNELDAHTIEYQNSYGAVKAELMSTEQVVHVSYVTFQRLIKMTSELGMATSFYDMLEKV